MRVQVRHLPSQFRSPAVLTPCGMQIFWIHVPILYSFHRILRVATRGICPQCHDYPQRLAVRAAADPDDLVCQDDDTGQDNRRGSLESGCLVSLFFWDWLQVDVCADAVSSPPVRRSRP